MTIARWLGLPVAVGLTWLIAASSGATSRWHPADASELRLSWSAPPERIERCRALSEAELAERPAHMRRAIECEGRAATYALEVLLDDAMLEQSVAHGGGLRQDRPLLLLRRLAVSEGEHRVRVRFARREPPDSAAQDLDSDDTDDTADVAGAAAASRERDRTAIPPLLVLDTLVRFRTGRAVLVTYRDGALMLEAPDS